MRIPGQLYPIGPEQKYASIAVGIASGPTLQLLLVHPRNHDPPLRVLVPKLLLVVPVLLLCPDGHLERADGPEQGGRRVEREDRVDEPAERLEEVVGARDGVERVPGRNGAPLWVVRWPQRAEDEMADQV